MDVSYVCRPQQHLLGHLFSLAFLWERLLLYPILAQPGCHRKRRGDRCQRQAAGIL